MVIKRQSNAFIGLTLFQAHCDASIDVIRGCVGELEDEECLRCALIGDSLNEAKFEYPYIIKQYLVAHLPSVACRFVFFIYQPIDSGPYLGGSLFAVRRAGECR